MAEEWALTRAEAARAKAAGDKARQKMAGQLIAGLKREIQQLGELPSCSPPLNIAYILCHPDMHCTPLLALIVLLRVVTNRTSSSVNRYMVPVPIYRFYSHSCSRGLEALYVRPMMCCCRDD